MPKSIQQNDWRLTSTSATAAARAIWNNIDLGFRFRVGSYPSCGCLMAKDFGVEGSKALRSLGTLSPQP